MLIVVDEWILHLLHPLLVNTPCTTHAWSTRNVCKITYSSYMQRLPVMLSSQMRAHYCSELASHALICYSGVRVSMYVIVAWISTQLSTLFLSVCTRWDVWMWVCATLPFKAQSATVFSGALENCTTKSQTDETRVRSNDTTTAIHVISQDERNIPKVSVVVVVADKKMPPLEICYIFERANPMANAIQYRLPQSTIGNRVTR